MGTIIDQLADKASPEVVRCTVCGHENVPLRYCRHVRWTFDQGDPIEFAKFAVETSPYVQARGFSSSSIPARWWAENGEWVVENVMLHFDASEGYVFGQNADLDLLARDIWKQFRPDPVRPQIVRVDHNSV